MASLVDPRIQVNLKVGSVHVLKEYTSRRHGQNHQNCQSENSGWLKPAVRGRKIFPVLALQRWPTPPSWMPYRCGPDPSMH